MSYLQWDDRKRTLGYQGLDFLQLALVTTPSSAVITLRLFESFTTPFEESSFVIEDGRGRPLPFSIKSQSSASKEVQLEILPPWDAGQYRLRLVEAAGQKLDPFFAELSFTFHIACERGDCRPLPAVLERLPPFRPVVDTVTKDYNGFVRLLSEWVKVRNPHFADLAPAALERVLLDLLAHHGDMTSYYQDRVAGEGFFEQATQRHSLRQHATLIGAELFDGTAAETELAFDWNSDGFVPRHTEVQTAKGASEEPVTFHTVLSARVVASHSRLPLAAWPSAVTAAVPVGAQEVLLFGHLDRLTVGQRIAFCEGALGRPGSLSQVVTVERIEFASEFGWVESPGDVPAAVPQDVTRIAFHPPIETDFRPWATPGAFVLYGNLIGARHGHCEAQWQPAKEELKDPHNAVTEHLGGLELLRAIRLPKGPVLHRRDVTDVGVVSVPLVEVQIDGEPWQRVAHLHASAPYDRHYVAVADEDGSLWLQFGDGIDGRALVIGAGAVELRVDYWVGSPTLGNVGAGALTRFSPEQQASHGVVNVVPAVNGRDPETKQAARFRVPASLRHGPLQRAVTLDDYARVAKSVPGVARAMARDISGPFNAVLVLVDPEGQIELSPRLHQDVEARVDALRMAGREIFVRGPRYVPIEVELAICVEPGFLAHRVRQAVLRSLLPAAAGQGYFHPDRLSFGEAIELSDVLAIVQRTPGVRSVKALKFRKLLVVADQDVQARLSVGVTEVIRMDGNSARPENGKLDVRIIDSDASVDTSKFLIAD